MTLHAFFGRFSYSMLIILFAFDVLPKLPNNLTFNAFLCDILWNPGWSIRHPIKERNIAYIFVNLSGSIAVNLLNVAPLWFWAHKLLQNSGDLGYPSALWMRMARQVEKSGKSLTKYLKDARKIIELSPPKRERPAEICSVENHFCWWKLRRCLVPPCGDRQLFLARHNLFGAVALPVPVPQSGRFQSGCTPYSYDVSRQHRFYDILLYIYMYTSLGRHCMVSDGS